MSIEIGLTPPDRPEPDIIFSKDWNLLEMQILEQVRNRQAIINARYKYKINIFLSPPLQSIERVGYQLVVSIPYKDEWSTPEEDLWDDVLRADIAEFTYPEAKIPAKLSQCQLPDRSVCKETDGVRFEIEPLHLISYLDYICETGKALPILPANPFLKARYN